MDFCAAGESPEGGVVGLKIGWAAQFPPNLPNALAIPPPPSSGPDK